MATISFNTTFDLTTSPNPTITFTDTTNWAGQGIALADVNGCFNIVAPSGVTIYNNTDFTNGGCDINMVNSLDSQQTISFTPEAGVYTITYTVYDSNLLVYSTKINTYDYQYESPEVEIEQEVDCITPLFTSNDITEYDVDGVTPTKTEVHTIYYPNGSAGQGSPVVGAGVTLSTGTFYNGTQTTTILSDLEYTFSDGLTVIDQIEGSKEILVDCTYICAIYCCLRAAEQRMENNRGVNQVKFNLYKDEFEQIMALVQLSKLAIECGKDDDVNGYLTQIKSIANCTDDCSCGDTPSLVTGIGGGGGGGQIYDVVSANADITVSSNTVGNTTTFTLTNNIPAFTLITNITWAGLDTLKSTNAMVKGYYRITDYQTTGTIPNTADSILGTTEPLIVFALDASNLYHQAWSEQFPQDIIHYELNDTSTQGAVSGRIYFRKDTLKNLEAPYDWRVWKFRRWETALGSGIFTEFTDPGGGEASQDFYTFGDLANGGTCASIAIKEVSLGDVALNAAPSDLLNNILIGLDSFDITIDEGCWNFNLKGGVAKNNHFESGLNGLNMDAATHVYADYHCEVFFNATPAARLSYFDGADALNVVLPTA